MVMYHLWIVQTVAQYLKETGNFAFLDKDISFYQTEENAPKETGTVWEHLVRAIEFTHNNIGTHNLPLLGFADWNDTVNLPTGAESLMVANLYGKALVEMMEICKAIKNTDYQAKLEGYYTEMQGTVNEYGWDGDWYLRYFDENGKPIGSRQNEAGANLYQWPILASHFRICY